MTGSPSFQLTLRLFQTGSDDTCRNTVNNGTKGRIIGYAGRFASTQLHGNVQLCTPHLFKKMKTSCTNFWQWANIALTSAFFEKCNGLSIDGTE